MNNHEQQSQQERTKEVVRQVIEQREEILRAFIAKYECGPDELIQVMQKTEDGSVKFCVRKKTENEESLGTVMHYLDKAVGDCGRELSRAQIMNDKTRAVIMKLRVACFREIRQELKKRMLEKPAASNGSGSTNA